MTKQVIIFSWGNDKVLGYSKLECETEWTMDMPEVPTTVAKLMKLTATDESIENMTKEMEAQNGKVYRFEIGESEDTWNCFVSTVLKEGINK